GGCGSRRGVRGASSTRRLGWLGSTEATSDTPAGMTTEMLRYERGVSGGGWRAAALPYGGVSGEALRFCREPHARPATAESGRKQVMAKPRGLYTPVYASMPKHEKVIAASLALKCDRHKFIGHLVTFWTWGLGSST